jgi:predicted dehydrogenase
MLKVGLIGLGAIGRMHFACWQKCPGAQLVALSARDPKKLAGEWSGQEFNLGDQAAQHVDLSGFAKYADALALIADPNVDAVDICTSTPQHAPLAIAALRAGKHVLCEKPMALTSADCTAMVEAARAADRQLMIAHCLRYSPVYTKAKELLDSGTHGRAIHASLQRVSALPKWSAGGWLTRAADSGGVVLDMHIHDVDVALWWFGQPASIHANGHCRDGLPVFIDALWRYDGGPSVHLHSAWDPNGGEFRHAFTLVMEKGTLIYDLSVAGGALRLLLNGQMTTIPVEGPEVHQAEIDDFAACLNAGRAISRITPKDSARAVAVALEELRQVIVVE